MKFIARIALSTAVSTALLASLASHGLADTVETKGLPQPNVKVKAVKGDNLVWVSQGGNDVEKPLSTIVRIEVTGEATFNDAEKAYVAEKWADAQAGYTAALRGASKDWMRDRISLRLVDLAGKTGRFDVAAAGYVSLISRNPTLAASVKPVIPADKDPKQLAGAVAEIEKGLGDAKLPAEQRGALLQFELEIQNALGDKGAASAVVEQIIKSGVIKADDPATQKQYGDLKVAMAQMALDSKDYAKAQSQIEEVRSILNDPQQQADALSIIAEAKYQAALAAKTTDKTAWQDIAIASMRVYALFPDRPAAADALARTAACYEQMKDNDKAIAVYQQVVRQYAAAPVAKTAKDAIARIQAGN
ncbi:hypothetical protein BH10PLA1_BH10PLA1_21730 [soil metagenome]